MNFFPQITITVRNVHLKIIMDPRVTFLKCALKENDIGVSDSPYRPSHVVIPLTRHCILDVSAVQDGWFGFLNIRNNYPTVVIQDTEGLSNRIGNILVTSGATGHPDIQICVHFDSTQHILQVLQRAKPFLIPCAY